MSIDMGSEHKIIVLELAGGVSRSQRFCRKNPQVYPMPEPEGFVEREGGKVHGRQELFNLISCIPFQTQILPCVSSMCNQTIFFKKKDYKHLFHLTTDCLQKRNLRNKWDLAT